MHIPLPRSSPFVTPEPLYAFDLVLVPQLPTPGLSRASPRLHACSTSMPSRFLIPADVHYCMVSSRDVDGDLIIARSSNMCLFECDSAGQQPGPCVI